MNGTKAMDADAHRPPSNERCAYITGLLDMARELRARPQEAVVIMASLGVRSEEVHEDRVGHLRGDA